MSHKPAQIGYNYGDKRSAGAQFAAASGVAHQDRSPDMRAKSIPTLTPAQIERFWEKVEVYHPAGCWTWTGSTSRGYGEFKFGRSVYKAHRVAYTLLIGSI